MQGVDRVCPRCGGDNRCGMGQDSPCWCATQLPPALPVVSPKAACYCQRCLTELLAEGAEGDLAGVTGTPAR